MSTSNCNENLNEMINLFYGIYFFYCLVFAQEQHRRCYFLFLKLLFVIMHLSEETNEIWQNTYDIYQTFAQSVYARVKTQSENYTSWVWEGREVTWSHTEAILLTSFEFTFKELWFYSLRIFLRRGYVSVMRS